MTERSDGGKSANSAESRDSGDLPKELGFVFVQMLFSLTAAEVARQFSILVVQGRAWDGVAAYAHLFLAGMVVVTSWVGWTRAKVKRELVVRGVFDWKFVVFMFDVGLVFLYFLLVRGAEIPEVGKPVIPSASNETAILAFIFVGYFLWDLLTKAVIKEPDSTSSFFRRLFSGDMRERGWISLVCMILAIVEWYFLKSVSTLVGVLLADASLLSLVVLFRAWKEKVRCPVAPILLLLFIGIGVMSAWFG